MSRVVFVAGGTGYIGGQLIPRLLARGHRVRALVRPGSEGKAPRGCDMVVGNPFDPATFAPGIAPADTFVQLVGVPHPSPSKAQQFVDIDLRSALASIAAARDRIHRSLRLRERGAARAGDEGLSGGARRGRARAGRLGSSTHDRPSVVCAGTRPPLAVRAAPDVLADGTPAVDARFRAPARSRHAAIRWSIRWWTRSSIRRRVANRRGAGNPDATTMNAKAARGRAACFR